MASSDGSLKIDMPCVDVPAGHGVYPGTFVLVAGKGLLSLPGFTYWSTRGDAGSGRCRLVPRGRLNLYPLRDGWGSNGQQPRGGSGK